MSEQNEIDAKDSYALLEAFVEAGFTREEALQILCRPHVNITTAATYPPEVMEFWERQNALATKMMFELDDPDS